MLLDHEEFSDWSFAQQALTPHFTVSELEDEVSCMCGSESVEYQFVNSEELDFLLDLTEQGVSSHDQEFLVELLKILMVLV